MPEAGSIGTRQDMRVRLGATLPPMLVTVNLASLRPIDPLNSELVAVLYQRETDSVPLAQPGLIIEELEQATPGVGRYLISCPRERILALNGYAQSSRASATSRTPQAGVRTLYWACFFEDAQGARFSLYYGRLSIYQGAAGA